MDMPSKMILFARVVDAGSFSAAARAVDHSPSAVSKQIAQLEDKVGVRLLTRSKRGIALTDDGRLFYERCAEISRNVAAAEDMVVSLGDHPKGTLHVASTVAFGKAQVLPILPRFLAENPEVQVAADFTDARLDFAEDSIDLAIRFTEQIEDQSLVARKIAHNRRILCVSPAYVAVHGEPEAPKDLRGHNCLRLSTVARWNDWNFGPEEIPVSGNFEANSADAVYHAALSGLGIARLSTYLVNEDIAAGRLIRLMPDYEDNDSDIYAVYSARRNLSPKVRAFIDFLVRSFSPVPPWEMSEDAAQIAAE